MNGTQRDTLTAHDDRFARHNLKSEVRKIGLAAVAQQGHHLRFFHLIALYYLDWSGDDMTIK